MDLLLAHCVLAAAGDQQAWTASVAARGFVGMLCMETTCSARHLPAGRPEEEARGMPRRTGRCFALFLMALQPVLHKGQQRRSARPDRIVRQPGRAPDNSPTHLAPAPGREAAGEEGGRVARSASKGYRVARHMPPLAASGARLQAGGCRLEATTPGPSNLRSPASGLYHADSDGARCLPTG